jgi:hypothetical protein
MWKSKSSKLVIRFKLGLRVPHCWRNASNEARGSNSTNALWRRTHWARSKWISKFWWACAGIKSALPSMVISQFLFDHKRERPAVFVNTNNRSRQLKRIFTCNAESGQAGFDDRREDCYGAVWMLYWKAELGSLFFIMSNGTNRMKS